MQEEETANTDGRPRTNGQAAHQAGGQEGERGMQSSSERDRGVRQAKQSAARDAPEGKGPGSAASHAHVPHASHSRR